MLWLYVKDICDKMLHLLREENLGFVQVLNTAAYGNIKSAVKAKKPFQSYPHIDRPILSL